MCATSLQTVDGTNEGDKTMVSSLQGETIPRASVLRLPTVQTVTKRRRWKIAAAGSQCSRSHPFGPWDRACLPRDRPSDRSHRWSRRNNSRGQRETVSIRIIAWLSSSPKQGATWTRDSSQSLVERFKSVRYRISTNQQILGCRLTYGGFGRTVVGCRSVDTIWFPAT